MIAITVAEIKSRSGSASGSRARSENLSFHDWKNKQFWYHYQQMLKYQQVQGVNQGISDSNLKQYNTYWSQYYQNQIQPPSPLHQYGCGYTYDPSTGKYTFTKQPC